MSWKKRTDPGVEKVIFTKAKVLNHYAQAEDFPIALDNKSTLL